MTSEADWERHGRSRTIAVNVFCLVGFVLVLLFETGLMYRPGCPKTHPIDQTDFNLKHSPAFAS